jgi:murein L,D-transpeptidase YcbB/YkuD
MLPFAHLGFTLIGLLSQPPASDTEALRSRVEQVHAAPATLVGGERLLAPDAVAHFFEKRGFEPAWRLPADGEQIVRAIRDIERDGLDPADYHEKAIGRLLNVRDASTSADLQILLSDAVAALVDHVRYGKVRPSTLDRRWNVDPRDGAPPLEDLLAQVAGAPDAAAAIDALKPTHFVYTGLKRVLATMRAQAATGWPTVPAGPTLKPGASDARVAAIRRRLLATGELPDGSTADSPRYDEALEAAVRRFQEIHRLTPDGAIGRATLEAMNVSPVERVGQVRVNLERARWVVGGLASSFVLVNLPAFKVYLIRDRKNIWEARTQIGREARQTPLFRADMRYLVLNPDWTVPPTILAQDILAPMRAGENPVARKGLTILDRQGRVVPPSSVDWSSATPRNFPYTLRQPPGPNNALGRVKFVFPNEHAIFLHDTPSQELFAADRRTFSSGCIRVEGALDLARVLLEPQGWTVEQIQRTVDAGASETVFLEQPLPVLIVYWTVSVGASGELRFARDVYGRDPRLLRALDE